MPSLRVEELRTRALTPEGFVTAKVRRRLERERRCEREGEDLVSPKRILENTHTKKRPQRHKFRWTNAQKSLLRAQNDDDDDKKRPTSSSYFFAAKTRLPFATRRRRRQPSIRCRGNRNAADRDHREVSRLLVCCWGRCFESILLRTFFLEEDGKSHFFYSFGEKMSKNEYNYYVRTMSMVFLLSSKIFGHNETTTF